MDTPLSILATFDDLRRWETVLTDGAAEIEFLRFAQSQDENRLEWLTAVQQAQRIQRELDASLTNVAGLETKLYHARRLLEAAERGKRDAEKARELLEKKIYQAHDLLYTENINEATRTKFAFLNGGNLTGGGGGGHHHNNASQRQHSTAAGAGGGYQARRSYKHMDVYGNEVNSTGSILSDLSVTHSEDDFLDEVQQQPGRMRKHQSSFVGDANASFLGVKRSRLSVDGKRRSSAAAQNHQQQQHTQHHHAQMDFISGTDKIVASTRVSIPHGNGPITAESVIEAIPEPSAMRTSPAKTATAKKRLPPPVPSTATAPPLYAFDTLAPTPLKNTAAGRSGASAAYQSLAQTPRQHAFAARTFLKSDTCLHCQKRIKFGSSALKCRECRICIHTDCRHAIMLACVPPPSAGSGPVTPKGGTIGVIADYAPNVSPMVPAIVVHCINEIESRGLVEVGIYRVSGSEKEVKALKERFLRGKTVPALHPIDVHVLCGCVKDFLRNLREPLVPTALWSDFSNAAQNACEQTGMRDMYRAISMMPQANRDTLAFLMQHFLRVSRAEAVKMPASNIAKVFGPTIVGYSSAEPDQHAIFTETIIQASVMEKLLHIPADFWCGFLTVQSSGSSTATSSTTGRYAPLSDVDMMDVAQAQYFGTPSVRKTGRKNKFYATPPYSTITKHAK